ncbi:F0F1 ATP synthase subunit A [Candidatus Uhrbacteria bacterium]|nr:F0F1 ATP synthase subunit A [Candidatus Uhrbacteria bacterium]MBD3284531.1 F0F1 ATP synthase subunit A [Candidatus Uhrbacteria bacterium]
MNVPLFAEPIFQLGSFQLTNAQINATLLSVALIIFAYFFRKRIKEVPGTLQAAVEMLLETLFGYFDQVTGDRERTKKFFPLVGTLFIFILLSNWLGLIPGTGSIGTWQMHHGEMTLIPILRPANSDLNLTLAMALISVIASHVFGIISVGFFVHWNRFFQFGTIWKAVRSLNPMNILVSLVEFVVGLIEFVSEIAKILSLSLRLFGNIFAGEVLITVIGSILAFVVPLPFMAFEVIVGVVQATVFAMLTLVYLTILTDKPHGEEEHHEEHAPAALDSENLIGDEAIHNKALA